MRDHAAVWNLFDPLYSDVLEGSNFFDKPPLLAHYTSTSVLEQIVKNDEVWFGNPLLMNDVEEVRFGINEGLHSFLSESQIRHAFLDPNDADRFETQLKAAFRKFEEMDAFDTYILCLCQHEENADGLLSMWRGYGDSGKGAALVFDPTGMVDVPDSPLIISKVRYASAEERYVWFDQIASQFSQIIINHKITGEEVDAAAWALFARLRLFSLFTKHHGFNEEREWRLAYMPERDAKGVLMPYLSYFNGPRGVEPKLKLPFSVTSALGQGVTLENLVHSIILGPSSSTPIAVLSVKRMLNALKRPHLAEKVVGSQIPYRSY